MEKILIETYADLIRRGVLFFSSSYRFDCGANACTVKYGDQFGVFLDSSRIRTARQEKRVVIHEWAHISGDATYRMDAPPALRQKAEVKAERIEIERLLPFKELRKAVQSGICRTYDLAEYFNVEEDDVRRAIAYYTGPCGLSFD